MVLQPLVLSRPIRKLSWTWKFPAFEFGGYHLSNPSIVNVSKTHWHTGAISPRNLSTSTAFSIPYCEAGVIGKILQPITHLFQHLRFSSKSLISSSAVWFFYTILLRKLWIILKKLICFINVYLRLFPEKQRLALDKKTFKYKIVLMNLLLISTPKNIRISKFLG